jgi:hypothetical protein
MSYRVIHGDCQDELKKLIEEEIQVDSIAFVEGEYRNKSE